PFRLPADEAHRSDGSRDIATSWLTDGKRPRRHNIQTVGARSVVYVFDRRGSWYPESQLALRQMTSDPAAPPAALRGLPPACSSEGWRPLPTPYLELLRCVLDRPFVASNRLPMELGRRSQSPIPHRNGEGGPRVSAVGGDACRYRRRPVRQRA